jgi:SP family sugar:H+ symporter-like MFS transporter
MTTRTGRSGGPQPEARSAAATVTPHIVFFFAMSWGVVVWVLLGEMFPNKIRALALSVAAGAQWLANWLVTVSFPSLSCWSLSGAYTLYALAAAISIGKTLESMG